MARPYDLVAFDVDGTLVDDTVFIWSTLHGYFGTDEEARHRVASAYMRGEITYTEWFDHDIAMLTARGATKAGIDRILHAMRPMRGAHETLARLQAEGIVIVVISGSLDVVLEHFFPDISFASVLINHLGFDEAGAIATSRATPYDMASKGAGLAHLAEEHGVPLSRTVFVGDNYNDISAAERAGLSIAFNSKSRELERVADLVIRPADLRLVLPHVLPES